MINTNPLENDSKPVMPKVLTKKELRAIELLVELVSKKLFEMDGKRDVRGYTAEIAMDTIRYAHTRNTPLGKFLFLESFKDMVNELHFDHLTKVSYKLDNLYNSIKENILETEVTNLFIVTILVPLKAELFFNIFQGTYAEYIYEALKTMIDSVDYDKLFNDTEPRTVHLGKYLTEYLMLFTANNIEVNTDDKEALFKRYEEKLNTLIPLLTKV